MKIKQWQGWGLGVLGLVGVAALGLGCLSQPFVQPRPSSPPPADPERLEAHVRRLAVDFYPRSFEQSLQLEQTARYIEAELRASGARVALQEFSVEESRYRNIVARFGPRYGPRLVVGAHYDSHGDVAAAGGPSPASHTPGADDNASGIAGLLELARLLGQHPPAQPVELVAYVLEEPPHFRTGDMGSARHARTLREAGQEVRLMLALEMIGYFRDEPGSQTYPLPGMTALYPDRGNYIALVGRWGDFGAMRRAKALLAGAGTLPVHSINAPRLVPGVDFSDHQSYWNEDYPALMLTDTAFYRNPHYHQAGDTPETLDYRRMAQVVQGVFALVHGY